MTDWKTLALVGGVLTLLAGATAVGQFLKLYPDTGLNPAAVRIFNLRLRAWWLMSSMLAATFLIGPTATVVLFGLLSFWALREFITLTPTRLGDHRALFWVFVLFTPLQYLLVGMGRQNDQLYNVLIPVYAFLFILARVAMSGDYKRFLERVAKIQTGLVICVYWLELRACGLALSSSCTGHRVGRRQFSHCSFFFILIVLNLKRRVAQFLWSKLVGRTVIAPTVSPATAKRGKDSIGGSASRDAARRSRGIYWATPFEPWRAAAFALIARQRDGICRRNDDVGLIKPRPRRKRLRHAGGRRARRRARPDRLALLCRPGVLPRRAILADVTVGQACGLGSVLTSCATARSRRRRGGVRLWYTLHELDLGFWKKRSSKCSVGL